MKRIAIYARKSIEAEKGESIKTQFAKCRDYINTMEGCEEYEIIEYKDEGYTGANTFRPDFQKLLREIDKGHIAMVVCHRLDRVTRSVADFSDIERRFKRHNVDFVSVNERFDTTTPMGEAMLKIVLVFAELERKMIKARVTENMFELAKTERWVSGKAPLGYKLNRVKIEGTKKKQTVLEIDEDAISKSLFTIYLESIQ